MHAGVSSSQLTGAARVGDALRSAAPLSAAATRATHMRLCSGGGGGNNCAASLPLRGARRTLGVALRAGGVTSAGIPAGVTERGATDAAAFLGRIRRGCRGGLLAVRRGNAAKADAAKAEAPADAAAADQPELAPSLCALRLRKLNDGLSWRRQHTKYAQEKLRKALEEAEAKVVRCQEELALVQVLSAHCTRAGDAAGAAAYGEAVRVAARALETAQNLLQEERTTGWPQHYAEKTAKELTDEERAYTLLRAYTQERHGVVWVAASALPGVLLSDDALRAMARAWRPKAAS
jgi:hypothetical protein